MTDQLDDQITEILNAVDAERDAVLADDGENGGETGELLEAADEARDLLESTEPRDVLEAVGLGTLPDGSNPETIPEAIAAGDSERVEDLHRLVRLARLADRSDETDVEGAVGDLREAIDRARHAADDSQMTEDDDQERADDEQEPTDDEQKTTSDEDDDTDLGERLRSAMNESFGGIGDELGSLQERLEEASATRGDTGETDTDANEEPAAAAKSDDDRAGDEDDGLLGGGLDGDSSDSSHHSTMAPPPSKRADMRAVKRHSTIPKRKDT